MFKNYLLIAWRHSLVNKLYAAINILGLVADKNYKAYFSKIAKVFSSGILE